MINLDYNDIASYYPPGVSTVNLSHPYYMGRDSITLSIFNDHRFAFHSWILWCCQKKLSAVDLVTLDWHQDLAYPYTDQIESLKELDITNSLEVSLFAWNKLSVNNDDHVVSAMYLNIIGDVYVVCKQNMDIDKDDEVVIDMYGNEHFIKKFKTIEEAYKLLSARPIGKVFFDIDLDYFTILNWSTNNKDNPTFVKEQEIKSILDIQTDFIKWIIERIQGFTIALEPQFTGGLTKSMRLLSLIEKTLFTGSVFNDNTTWKHF